MSKTTIDDVTIEIVRGDIADQPDMDAIVNAANAALQTGGGVAGAIHRAAGPGLAAEGRRYAPIEPGDAVITGAHELPNHHVIHCLGPVYGRDEPADPAARIALGAVLQALPGLSTVQHIRFVLFGESDAALYEETLRFLQQG